MSQTASLNETILLIDKIKELIPHRYPMLLVDRVEEVISDKSATGIKNVTVNEWFFEGHFPSSPIMPGVLIVEAMAQTAGILVMHTLKGSSKDHLVYFMSIDEARFRKPVTPGDTLKIKVEKIQSRGPVWKFNGKAYVEEALVAEAIYTAMIAKQ